MQCEKKNENKNAWRRQMKLKGYWALEANICISRRKSPSILDTRMNLLEAYLFFTACCLAVDMFCTSLAIL